MKAIGRVGKKYALYPPKEMLKQLGLGVGDKVLYRLEEGKLVVEPLENPFEYALKVEKWARTSLKELEEFSEKLQASVLEED